MADTNKQTGLVKLFPDILPFRRLASRMKIRQVYQTALPEADVRRGEASVEERNRMTESCCRKWETTAAKVNHRIDDVFRTVPFYAEQCTDLDAARKDMLFHFFAYGFEPNEYFAFRLDEKTPEETQAFISGRRRMKYRCQMNNLLQAHLFNDKAQTYELFREYYRRDAVAIEHPEDYDAYHAFVDRHPVFVKKQVYLAQGQSVELVDLNNAGKNEREVFEECIAKGKHILEERIIQSPELSSFNPSSVNTVRAITFNTKHGIRVPYCMIRTGQPGAFVDNSGNGGIQAEIDFATGTAVSDGYDELGGVYAAHPATGLPFQGYRLPDWGQLKELIFTTAASVPTIRFIGWDLAHTKNGWVIVEGNENCYIIALQQIRNKGMRPVFEELMADMELYA